MTSDYTRLRNSLKEPLSTVAAAVERQVRIAASKLPPAARRILRSDEFLVDATTEACAWFAAHYNPARPTVEGFAFICARKGLSVASRIHLGRRWRGGESRQVSKWFPASSLEAVLDPRGDGGGLDRLMGYRVGTVMHESRNPDVDNRDTRPALDVLTSGLRPVERYVIVMRFRHGLTLAEIGTSLGVSREAVRIIERRALAHLRKQAGPDINDSVERRIEHG